MKKIEKLVISYLYYVLSLGILVSYIDKQEFKNTFIREDGLLENMSVVFLLASCGICLYRIKTLWAKKSRWFLCCTGFLALLLFFGAGEEISWGQRIFGWHSNEFFAATNTQGETNFHNLKIGDKKINKLIFGLGMGIFLSIYLLLFPLLYRSKAWFQRWVDAFAIPIPQEHHVWAYLGLFLTSFLTLSAKRGELLEFGGTCLFFLIILYPANKELFKG